MSRDKLMQNLKSLWLALVFVALGVIVYKHHDQFIDLFSKLSWIKLTCALSLLILGKIFFAQIARMSLNFASWSPTYQQIFYVLSITQLAKYLPGGIWHFVGQFGFYCSRGISKEGSARAILVQNLWLVCSSLCSGVLFLLLSCWGCSAYPLLSSYWMRSLLIFLLLGLWLFTISVIEIVSFRSFKLLGSLKLNYSLLFCQLAAWLLASSSAAVLVPEMSLQQLLSISGAFAISWCVGYLAVFAPGGVGIREGAFVFLLEGVLSGEQALFLAMMHRLIWTIDEVLLGAIMLFAFRPKDESSF